MIPRFPGEPPRDLSQPLEEVKLRIDERCAGLRLDKALSILLAWRSRTSVQRLIAEGRVHVGDRPARPSLRLQLGEVVRIDVPPDAVAADPAPAGIELDVLREDRWMIAIDKAAGMAVHPAGRTLGGTVIQALHRRYRRPDDPARDVVPRLMHRIDRETSGVLAVALDERFSGLVGKQFEDREVTKTYLAVCHGCPSPPRGVIDLPIGPARRSAVRLKQEARTDGVGLPSLTRYTVLARHGDFSLVELVPKTGRTHQIRVHMAAIGHPLVGDKIYGPDERFFLDHLQGGLDSVARERLILGRHALHAHGLRFFHPFLATDVTLEAPLPADMRALVGMGAECDQRSRIDEK